MVKSLEQNVVERLVMARRRTLRLECSTQCHTAMKKGEGMEVKCVREVRGLAIILKLISG